MVSDRMQPWFRVKQHGYGVGLRSHRRDGWSSSFTWLPLLAPQPLSSTSPTSDRTRGAGETEIDFFG